jgi:ketosteroid isomerase-like protein
MSQENVEVVRRVIDYLNETGGVGPLDLYDAEVTFKTRGDFGGPEMIFTGHPGMSEAVARFGQLWASTTAHITELIEGDDIVVAVVRIELRSQAGKELEVKEAWVHWLRDGKLTRIEQYGSKEKALEAAGLRQ